MRQIMTCKMRLAESGKLGSAVGIKRLAGDRLQLIARLIGYVEAKELQAVSGLKDLIADGSLQGEWLIGPGDWTVKGRPKFTLSPSSGTLQIECVAVTGDVGPCILTKAGEDAALEDVLVGIEEARAAYRKQVEVAHKWILDALYTAEDPDTEWTLTRQPQQQGTQPLVDKEDTTCN